MREARDVPLGPLTTLRVGGPARRLLVAETAGEVVSAVREADAVGEPLLVLGGGSNVVVADDGFAGTVVVVASRGMREDGELVHVEAGEPWDPLVTRAVVAGRQGVECLAGIPGSTGATPVQNVGAYGQEVADTIVSVSALDRHAGEVVELEPGDCGFAYRDSRFKREPGRWVVLRVAFRLARSERSAPVRYAELARALGVEPGDTAPLADVRAAVLALRRRKGMVVDPADPDSASAGSFFTNPILDERAFAPLGALGAPAFPQPDGRVKTSAAWLIERAGFARGHARGPVALSAKHTLALTNRGGATAADLLALAREVRAGVHERFGVVLEPEPRLIGQALPQMARHELRPIFDRVVIKELEPDRMRASGLVVPPGTHEPPPQHGIVLAVGQGVDWWESAGVRMPVKPGDHVVFPAQAGTWVEVDEERLLVCRVTELLGVLETVD